MGKEKLTETQLYMIKQIEEAIKKEREKIKTASDSYKYKLRIKIRDLEKQLEEAKKPFARTKKEKELIEKIAKNVKENAEITPGKKIEGVRSDRELSSKEEFENGLELFIQEVKIRKEQLIKDIEVQKGIVDILSKHKPVGEKTIYLSEIETRKKIVAQMEMSLELFEDRINETEIVEWALENYGNISKLNTYLNNPLKLKDYEIYSNNLRNKYGV